MCKRIVDYTVYRDISEMIEALYAVRKQLKQITGWLDVQIEELNYKIDNIDYMEDYNGKERSSKEESIVNYPDPR